MGRRRVTIEVHSLFVLGTIAEGRDYYRPHGAAEEGGHPEICH